jgi:hypothetical protein
MQILIMNRDSTPGRGDIWVTSDRYRGNIGDQLCTREEVVRTYLDVQDAGGLDCDLIKFPRITGRYLVRKLLSRFFT